MTLLTAGPSAGTARYSLLVAAEDDQIRAAQRLRYRVFAEELGAAIPTSAAGLDADEFDTHCDHLIVRDDTTGEVVGTYRMLPPGRTSRLYTDTEFDLRRLAALRDGLVETGRSCVHPDHRTGAVVGLMWAGIARYLHLHGRRWLIGCASVPLDSAAAVWNVVSRTNLGPPALRVSPHRPWPVDGDPQSSPLSRSALPALLRGYLRLGAWVCGPPAHDPDFRVADLPVLMSMDRIDPRYLRRFLGTDG